VDSRTGDLYPDIVTALKAGVPREHLVEIRGRVKAIARLARAAQELHQREVVRKRKAKRRQQRESRKANREGGRHER
jgi:hypothetical protein